MNKRDVEILTRCVDKEGFEYAMLHYSSYDHTSPERNRVDDEKFHELRKNFIKAHDELANYLREHIESDNL